MNQAENEAGNKAMDSLINYETVKVYYIMYLIITVTMFLVCKKKLLVIKLNLLKKLFFKNVLNLKVL